MLHILLTILKFLLFAVLIILGLILFLLLLVLLSPIHYRADVKYKDKVKVFAKIRYLIVTIRVSFDQETKELVNETRVLGIRLKGKKKKPEDETDPEAEIEKHGKSYDEFAGAGEDDLPEIDIPEAGEDDLPEIDIPEASKTEKEADTAGKHLKAFKVDYGEPEALSVSEDSSELIEVPQDIENGSKEENVNFVAGIIAKVMDTVGRIVSKVASVVAKVFEKISDKADEISDKVDSKIDDIDSKIVKAEQTIDRFEKFWELECTEKTKVYLSKYIKSVIRHIAPRKAKGYAEYGFDDAAKTGEVTGYLSLLPCMYQKKLYLYPNFQDKVMDIEVSLKGYIVLGYLARIIFSINLWKTLMAARKLKSSASK